MRFKRGERKNGEMAGSQKRRRVCGDGKYSASARVAAYSSTHRFCTVSLTVTRRPFQSLVALATSSPTFLGDRPRGPILGARVDVAPTSPPTARRYTGRWGRRQDSHGNAATRKDGARENRVEPRPCPQRSEQIQIRVRGGEYDCRHKWEREHAERTSTSA